MCIRLDSKNNTVELIRCPQCEGHGFVLGNDEKIDENCTWCGGSGIVSTMVCTCGRPILWRVGNHASCNILDCYNKAVKAAKEDGFDLKWAQNS